MRRSFSLPLYTFEIFYNKIFKNKVSMHMYSPHIIQDVKGISYTFIPFPSHKQHHGDRFYSVE